MPKPFNCTACGAPVIAEPGTDIMSCPYCNSALTIPPHHRRKAKLESAPAAQTSRPRDPFSAAASLRLDDATRERSQRESEMLANGLRRVQPVALKAARLYNIGILARHYLPGCITVLAIACLLGCATIAVAGFYLARLNLP
jgi:DNA-directed RNA polymerase subunit RPC12/RpoP